MSGFAGAVCADNQRPPCADLMAEQAAAIRHRGPDGQDSWSSDGIHLLHAHHDTTGFRENNLAAERALVRIAGDIRLDNRAELAERLQITRFSELADTELVLRAYVQWGRACCQYLTGDFAFAIWDQNTRTLFCARDPLGVKPLFYMEWQGDLLFSSELAGVTRGRGVIDEARIASFLTGFSDSFSGTAFSNALRLAPGHWLAFRDGGTVTQRYWDPTTAAEHSGESSASTFRGLFEQAVTGRLRGTSDVGAMLSGGLDSSSIVCVAAPHIEPRKLRTYSFAYPGTPALDERQYVDAVLDAYAVDPTFVPLDDFAPLDGLNALAEGDSDLIFGPGLPKMARVFHVARQSGSKVLLDGHGGDEVVSHGFGRLRELARAGHWLALHREVRGLGKTFGESSSRLFLHYWTMHGAGRRAGHLIGRLRALAPQNAPSGVATFLRPQFAARTGIEARYGAWAASFQAARATELGHHLWSVTSPGVAEGFEALDRVSSRAGVELRFPFFDANLVQFALGLPASEILQDGWSRSVLRRAMQDILPAKVQWRRDKIDFSPEIRSGLAMHADTLLAVAGDHDGVGAFVDLGRLDRAIQQLLASPDTLPPGDLFMIWRCVFLFHWLKNRSRKTA